MTKNYLTPLEMIKSVDANNLTRLLYTLSQMSQLLTCKGYKVNPFIIYMYQSNNSSVHDLENKIKKIKRNGVSIYLVKVSPRYVIIVLCDNEIHVSATNALNQLQKTFILTRCKAHNGSFLLAHPPRQYSNVLIRGSNSYLTLFV